jgi:NADH:ubiquinone oxidoreductase subunit
MGFLRAVFVWWRDATAGTVLNTWVNGRFVGRDGYGNRYYQSRDGKRRWALFRGMVDGSKIPAGWHAWLHHNADAPPDNAGRKSWESDHLPNLSGTKAAYYPTGSLQRGGRRGKTRGDYESWSP